MIRFECDKCGEPLKANDAQRYIVKMEVFAAASHIDLDSQNTSNAKSQLQDVMHTLASANPDDVEDQTYRAFRFDVCNQCRKNILHSPLG